MKKLLLLAAFLPFLGEAAEKEDTTFVVKDKKIVVDVDGSKTNVKVFGNDGVEQTKVSEMNFVDGQEVEQVYVGSPFLPTSNLQHIDFAPRYPTVWFGMANITGKVFGTSQLHHARFSKSFEFGVTPYYMSVPFNKQNSMGLSIAAQLVWSHLCFQKDYVVTETGGKWDFVKMDQRADGNNINYMSFRLPMMFTVDGSYDFYLGLGLSPEIRTNAWYKMKGNISADGTYKLNRLGLNMSVVWGIGPLVFSGSLGLTPLFKTVNGKKAYQNSCSVGVDVLSLVKLINSGKKKNKNKIDF